MIYYYQVTRRQINLETKNTPTMIGAFHDGSILPVQVYSFTLASCQ